MAIIDTNNKEIPMNNFMTLISVFLIILQPAVQAGELDIPNSFTTGTPAVAADVNSNFTAVETAVDGNAADIAAMLATITAMEAILVIFGNRQY